MPPNSKSIKVRHGTNLTRSKSSSVSLLKGLTRFRRKSLTANKIKIKSLSITIPSKKLKHKIKSSDFKTYNNTNSFKLINKKNYLSRSKVKSIKEATEEAFRAHRSSTSDYVVEIEVESRGKSNEEFKGGINNKFKKREVIDCNSESESESDDDDAIVFANLLSPSKVVEKQKSSGKRIVGSSSNNAPASSVSSSSSSFRRLASLSSTPPAITAPSSPRDRKSSLSNSSDGEFIKSPPNSTLSAKALGKRPESSSSSKFQHSKDFSIVIETYRRPSTTSSTSSINVKKDAKPSVPIKQPKLKSTLPKYNTQDIPPFLPKGAIVDRPPPTPPSLIVLNPDYLPYQQSGIIPAHTPDASRFRSRVLPSQSNLGMSLEYFESPSLAATLASNRRRTGRATSQAPLACTTTSTALRHLYTPSRLQPFINSTPLRPSPRKLSADFDSSSSNSNTIIPKAQYWDCLENSTNLLYPLSYELDWTIDEELDFCNDLRKEFIDPISKKVSLLQRNLKGKSVRWTLEGLGKGSGIVGDSGNYDQEFDGQLNGRWATSDWDRSIEPEVDESEWRSDSSISAEDEEEKDVEEEEEEAEEEEDEDEQEDEEMVVEEVDQEEAVVEPKEVVSVLPESQEQVEEMKGEEQEVEMRTDKEPLSLEVEENYSSPSPPLPPSSYASFYHWWTG